MGRLGSHSLLTSKNKTGLVLAGLAGIADLTSAFDLSGQDGDHPGPPTAILAVDVVLGLVTVVAVVHAWRTGNRAGSRVAAAARILSALTALPAFFVEGVPPGLVAVVAVFVILTVITVALLLSRPAPAPPALEPDPR